ncbi:MAG: YigZ family protein [Chloroflexi bacterium HGW-Chloroflexi-1]|nr:MAG: YigZ family protein [Chloroflexi bacterium HGW-Chloroflexi-1]
MSRYRIPATRARVEEIIRRSRFITTAAPAATPAAARAFIAEMRAEFADATHNCYAFVAGPPGSTAQAGMSDDGEPGGMAGRPMLAVLLGSGVGDIAVVVTRYYGGTKLGTGGLVRAYSGGVKAVLAGLSLAEKVALVTITARGPYHWITPVERLLPDFEARITGQTYTADVTWQITLPEERAAGLVTALTELSHGEIEGLI